MNEESLKKVVALSASICTILSFLTGVLVCLKIHHNKNTGSISSLPFVCGCLSSSLWFKYGHLVDDSSIILVNFVGISLYIAYILVYFYYSIKKANVINQCTGCIVFLLIIIYYIGNIENENVATSRLGIICCIITILFFASPLATLFQVIKVKNTESLPFPIISASFIVTIQWLLYGILINDTFIQIPNLLGCLLSGFQLSLFCIYPNNKKNKTISNELV